MKECDTYFYTKLQNKSINKIKNKIENNLTRRFIQFLKKDIQKPSDASED